MLLAAFIMGLVGSLHCAIMCGPLALAIPAVGRTRNALIASRIVYNSGRISTYALLGIIFGAIGKSLLLVGLQRWLSILTGAAMIVLLALSLKGRHGPLLKGTFWIKSLFGKFLTQRSFVAIYVLGALNGLLPCGLVYMAGTASAATGDPLDAAAFMIVFGLGTFPVMFSIAQCRSMLLRVIQARHHKAIVSVAVTLVALALILRGLALGIPYLSPATSSDSITCPACIEEEATL